MFKPEVFFDTLNALPWYQETLRQWVSNNKFSPNAKILEVGCATGALTAYLSESGYIPTGVDASLKMIERAKVQYPSLTFIEASVENLPFDDETFDTVISASLINVLDDKESAIKEMRRVCKKGGVISIFVPSQAFTPQQFTALKEKLMLEGFSATALEAWNSLAKKMGVQEVNDLLKQEGLFPLEPESYLESMVLSISAHKRH